MLDRVLEGRQEEIAERWVELVFASYPQETSRFLEREKDPFANPVGRLVREAAGPLVAALGADRPGPEAMRHLDALMRLRSVQDVTAGDAVGVVGLLRRAVLDVLGDEGGELGAAGMLELSERVERLLLAAFEVFTACREQLYEVRARELARRQASLLRRAERLLEEQRTETEEESGAGGVAGPPS